MKIFTLNSVTLLLNFIQALLTSWPFVLLILMLFFRKQIQKVPSAFQSVIAKRINNVKYKDFEISLSNDIYQLNVIELKLQTSNKKADVLSEKFPKKSIEESYNSMVSAIVDISKSIFPDETFLRNGQFVERDFFDKLKSEKIIDSGEYSLFIQLSDIFEGIRTDKYDVITSADAFMFRALAHDMRRVLNKTVNMAQMQEFKRNKADSSNSI